jgi:hypothetical protein
MLPELGDPVVKPDRLLNHCLFEGVMRMPCSLTMQNFDQEATLLASDLRHFVETRAEDAVERFDQDRVGRP